MSIEKRETSAWAIATVLGLLGIAGAWNAYHDGFEDKGEAKAIGSSLLIVIKNIQRGRLSAYADIPNSELSTMEQKNKVIIEYDLRNIDLIEQAVGLETPNGN